jgi:hypothetical protein
MGAFLAAALVARAQARGRAGFGHKSGAGS